MKNSTLLTVLSLIGVISFALHWTDEITRGMETAKIANFPGVLILIVWLSGPLVFRDRILGYIIMLLGGLLGFAVLVLHMTGEGLTGGRIANTNGIFFWVLTALTLGTTSFITAVLAAHALWSRWRLRDAGRGRREA